MQHHQLFWRLTRLTSVFVFSFSCAAVPGWSDVTGSGNTSVSGATDFVITNGDLSGSNLFHSFTDFDLTSAQSATFENFGAVDIANVIGRIDSSGDPGTSIDGTVSFDVTAGSRLTGANLFLIDPLGITFGSNASIDVPASFHASTADYIEFSNGDTWGDAVPVTQTLSVASPVEFGFLNIGHNALTVNAGADFVVGTDQTLSLTGAGITLTTPDLDAPSGQIYITSVNSSGAGEVNINSSTTSTFTSGNITSTDGIIDTSGTSSEADADARGAGGEIYISGGNLTFSDTNILSLNNSDIASGDITFRANGAISISGGFIYSGSNFISPKGDGDSGDISLIGDTVSIDSALIYSLAADDADINDVGDGDSGSILIRATGDGVDENFDILDATNGAFNPTAADVSIVDSLIYSSSSGQGTAGNVVVDGGNSGGLFFNSTPLNVDTLYVNNSRIYSESFNSDAVVGSGNTRGSVNLNASYALVTGASEVRTDTNGDGDAGFIGLRGINWLVDGGSEISSSTTAAGDAGSISIAVNDFTLDAATVSSSAAPDTDNMVDTGVTGSAGDIIVAASCASFFCFTFGSGTDSFILKNGAQVLATTATLQTGNPPGDPDVLLTPNAGNGGSIDITTRMLTVTGAGSEINTSTVDSAGGDIDINLTSGLIFLPPAPAPSPALTGTLSDGGEIISNTYGDGDAGTISISGGDWTLTGSGTENQVGSNQEANGLGDAGAISITANSVLFQTGGRISSSTTSTATGFEVDGVTPRTSDAGSITISAALVDTDGVGLSRIISDSNLGIGDAGNITINADTLNLDFADVFANNRIGAGGLIDFNVTGTVTIDGNTFVRAISNGSGAAGFVEINATDFILDDISYVRSSATGGGDAGVVSIAATNSVEITNGSDIQSSAIADGAAGGIIISTDTFTLDNSQLETDNVNGSGGDIFVMATTQGNITNLNSGDMVGAANTVSQNEQTLISSSTGGSANAGAVVLTGGAWNISGDPVDNSDGKETIESTVIQSTTEDMGDAGDVSITADTAITITTFANITSNALAESSGDAGNILITTEDAMEVGDAANDTITISGDAIVQSNSVSLMGTQPTGNAGSIDINTDIFNVTGTNTRISTNNNAGPMANGTISITSEVSTTVSNGAKISSNTAGSGDAGSVSIDSGESILISSLGQVTSNANVGSTGDAGDILLTTEGTAGGTDVATDTITINGNAKVQSNSDLGTGNAGSITIDTDIFDLNGTDSEVSTNNSDGTDVGGMFDNGQISVNANVTGQVRTGGRIRSNTDGDGDAGSVSIRGGNWTLTGSAGENQIESNQTSNGDYAMGGRIGDAGLIDVMVNRLTLQQGGRISSSTTSDAMLAGEVSDAGDITITADDGVMGTDDFIISSSITFNFLGFTFTFPTDISGISANADAGIGEAGRIQINADSALISDALIQTATNDGAGGDIMITADEKFDATGTSISAGTIGAGEAGSISLVGGVGSDWDLSGTTVSTGADTTSTNRAGDITIGVDDLMLDGDSLIASNSTATGMNAGFAGQIDITANTFILDGATIETNTVDGNTGGISSDAGLINISAGTGIIRNTGAFTSQISSNTTGTGDAGAVALDASTWNISGDGALLSTQVLSVSNGSSGNAGLIGISADSAIVIDNFAQIASSAGNGSTGNAGRIFIDTERDVMTDVSTDTILIQNGARITSNATNGGATGAAGAVDISTDLFTIDGATISTETNSGIDLLGGGQIGAITITAIDTGTVQNSSAITPTSITASTVGSGLAGDVILEGLNWNISGNASDTEISRSTIISSNTTVGTGNAGRVGTSISGALTISQFAQVATNTQGTATGNAGDIFLMADNSVTIETGAEVASNSITSGAAGKVAITTDPSDVITTDFVAINSGGEVSSSSSVDGIGIGTGDAGSVSITTDLLRMNDGEVTTETENGNGGNIQFTVKDVNIENGSDVSADSDGSGDAGDVIIMATNSVNINTGSTISSSSDDGTGSAGNIGIRAGDITLDAASVATTNRNGTTLANIDLFATNPTTGIITNGASVVADTVGTGDAGNITLRGPVWIIDGGSTVSSSTTGAVPMSGDAGSIDITPTTSFLLDGATVQTDSSNAGESGAINISSELITLTNGGTVQSNVSGTGDGGVITFNSGSDIFLSNGAQIATNTNPNAAPIMEGDAGDIFINAVDSLSMISSLLTSSTTSDGEAGTVTINTGENVYLLDSTVLVDSRDATTNGVGGGDLNVTTGILVLDGSTLDASAGSGTGGNVAITADFFFISPDSVIDVSSGSGASGTVSVNAVAVDLSGSLNALKVKFKDGGKLLQQACSTRDAASNSSSFIVENGIEGIPSSPVDFQSGSILDLTITPSLDGQKLETSANDAGLVSPAGTALFAAVACGAF